MGEMTADNKRKIYIDAVKGFCIILVLFAHAGGIPYIGVLCACYMQAYFVIAGITYNDRKEETLRRFVLKKAKRLLIPYAVYGTVLWVGDCICERFTFPEIIQGGVGLVYARHCLFLYQGSKDNLFLLANLNGQLWFLPAIFISYILFWFIVKADIKIRPIIVVGYIAVNIGTSFLPILLPWSLDTAFITAVLMYFGFLLKSYLCKIERLDIKGVFRPKALLLVLVTAGVYLTSVKLCGGINTSVRIFGSHGVLSILLYILVGILGTILFLVGFAIAENTVRLNAICGTFAYFGRHTIVLLATHLAIFKILESGMSVHQLNLGYTETLIKVVIATTLGIIMGIGIEKLGTKNKWVKLLL